MGIVNVIMMLNLMQMMGSFKKRISLNRNRHLIGRCKYLNQTQNSCNYKCSTMAQWKKRTKKNSRKRKRNKTKSGKKGKSQQFPGEVCIYIYIYMCVCVGRFASCMHSLAAIMQMFKTKS